jgi:hypothetical protein
LEPCFAFDKVLLGDVYRREDDVDIAWKRVLHVTVFGVLFLRSPRASELFGQTDDVVDFDIQM